MKYQSIRRLAGAVLVVLAAALGGCVAGEEASDGAVTSDDGAYSTTTLVVDTGFVTEVRDPDGQIVATADLDPTGVGELEIVGVSSSPLTVDDVSTPEAINAAVFTSFALQASPGDLPYVFHPSPEPGVSCAGSCSGRVCCVCCPWGCVCGIRSDA